VSTTLEMDDNQKIALDHIGKSSRTNKRVDSLRPFLNQDGHLDFAPGDLAKPANWSIKHKCYITGVAILLVMNATFASSAPTGAIQGIMKEMDISNEVAGLVTTMFLLGFCTGPLVWAPLSEFYGYAISELMFVDKPSVTDI
jgi:DHA1 family multidrug resistance protein-like MFS transporter